MTPKKLQSIRRALASTAPQKVELHLPRLTLRSPLMSLLPCLQKMGLQAALSRTPGNYAGISREPLYVSDVLQRCVVIWDEEGTEAAAATALGVKTWSIPAPPPCIRFDRPFIWYIGDLTTSTPPLFMGYVSTTK